MNIKNLTWLKAFFAKIIFYIQQNHAFNPYDKNMVLHNIRNNSSLENVIREFEINDSLRTNLRRNSVRFYHDILSFKSEDSKHLTDRKKEMIAQKYIESRAPNAIVFGRWHYDREHEHLHLCISATEYRSPDKTLRMNNKRFSESHRSMEKWQQKEMPELTSIVYLNKPEKKRNAIEQDRNTRKQREFRMKKNLPAGVPTEKELLQDRLDELINHSYSRDEFYDYILKQPDLELYGYPGLYVGVQIKDSRKYRFETLQLQKRILELDNKELQQIKMKELELQSIRNRNKTREKSILLQR